MKTLITALFMSVIAFSKPSASAQTPDQIQHAGALYRHGLCLMDKAQEMRGGAGRDLIHQAMRFFNGALRIVSHHSPEPGRWTWVASKAELAVAQERLNQPDFAVGAPSRASITSCDFFGIS